MGYSFYVIIEIDVKTFAVISSIIAPRRDSYE